MNLRDYQSSAVDAVFRELESAASTLIVLPTGTGKTVVFSAVARRWPEGRVCVMAHREELILQAADKVGRVVGEHPAVEMGESRADVGQSLIRQPKVVVTSVQTMSRSNRLSRFDPDEFGLLVIDEAHHATAGTYGRVIDHYRRNQRLRVLGVTATPDRADEEALGRVFDTVAYHYEIPDAIHDGYLVPIDQQYVTVDGLDFSKVRTTAGDLNGADLDAVLNTESALHGVVMPTMEIAGDRPAIIFAATVAHAERMAEIICRVKPAGAVCLHGETDRDDRRRQLQRYKAGEFQYLVNCGLFLEGFDEPRVEVVAVARPTKSRSLYAQMIGRGTRPLPGVIDRPGLAAAGRRDAIFASPKQRLLVLDYVGNSGRHKLVSVADILGGKYPEDVVDRAKVKAAAKNAAGEPADVQAELFAAHQEAEDEARRKRMAVVATVRYSRQEISPFDVFDISPRREPGWFKGKPPTERQLEVLAKAGMKTDSLSFFQASQLIDEMVQRREKGLCTFKQAKILTKYGYTADVTFEQASAIIDDLARNGWRKPDAARAS